MSVMIDHFRRTYRAFAEHQAHGRSPLYEQLALRIADDAAVHAFLSALPLEKTQPNLLLAAVRHVAGETLDWPAFRRVVTERTEELARVMLTRTTQTNEPARCATLMPVLAALPQPLALLEVGAAAGLCLLPDRYGYAFRSQDHVTEVPPVGGGTQAPFFECAISGPVPPPRAPVDVIWRAGIDLNPLDVASEADTGWLEALVWPGPVGDARTARLRQAVAVARDDPPRVVCGDLRRDLAPLAAEAPPQAPLVVFHTAVLAYVASDQDREAFAREVRATRARWISNEAPRCPPARAVQATHGRHDAFLLTVDDRPIAHTDPHGAAFIGLSTDDSLDQAQRWGT